MDHLKRFLIIMPVCWALTIALPADATLDAERSVTTTIELAVGAFFQAAPLTAQNENGNGGEEDCEICYNDNETTCGDVHSSPSLFDPTVQTYCQGKDPEHFLGTIHYFPHPGWGCIFGTSDPDCRECGEDCHKPWKFGVCEVRHASCPDEGGGSDPDLAMLKLELHGSTENHDVGHLVGLLLPLTERYSLEVASTTLRLDGACGGAMLPIPPGVSRLVRIAVAVLDDLRPDGSTEFHVATAHRGQIPVP